MLKKPTQLVAARAALEKAEEDLGDPGRFVDIKNAINSVLGVMSGVSPQIEIDIAKRLLLKYRSKVLSEVKLILANVDSHEAESLEHWHNLMEVFLDAHLGGDPEFKACKEQLLTKCSHQSIQSSNPVDLQSMEKKLKAALDSLAVHRTQLLNIKSGIQK
jgi:hypothetical protein